MYRLRSILYLTLTFHSSLLVTALWTIQREKVKVTWKLYHKHVIYSCKGRLPSLPKMKVYDTSSLSLSFVFIVATAKSVEISGNKKLTSTASMRTSVASLSANNSLDSTRGIETTKFTTDSPATNSKEKKTTTQYHHNVKDLNVSSNHGKATTTAADTHGTSFKNLNQKRHNSPRPAPLNAKLDSGIIGSLLIGLLAVIIIIVLFVVLMCMMHRWRTNMIQS